ncbi:hypothetical protein J8V57_17205 [Xenorhabdus sp. PB61.4]|uniref:hypothetical protein n=1 Tax=Xenorhabdus sp. PB61.4 TaxID=2788940 RepID=UPI001E4FCA53|nr:hypothetical protein [Xenorhabdus sp. PB61.4]MCC8367980.1 hypothetical protein [Xenorhabdus sp. PB61.4]
MKGQLGVISMDFTMPSQEQLQKIVASIELEYAVKRAPINNITMWSMEREAIKRAADLIMAKARFNHTPINKAPEKDVDRVGSDTQQDTKGSKLFNYWKVEIHIEGQDMAIVGYSRDEIPFSTYDSDYLTIYQNRNRVDTITIPLSRVIAIKSYAVTK